jgi:hypothetical protein
MSLAFTLIGALIFAVIKGHEANIPQEAIIGISYAVASAAVILATCSTRPSVFVVTRSVAIAGVLLVFCYLIVKMSRIAHCW